MLARLRIAVFLALVTPLTLALIPLQWLFITLDWPLARSLPVFYHRLVCVLLRLKIRVLGTITQDEPLLLLSNHSSWLDIVALSSVMPVSFIAKSEVAGWPIFGLFARLQRSVFIDRSRRMATRDAHRAVSDRLTSGDAIVLFAEGTTSDGHRVLSFRSSLVGAASEWLGEAKAKIQPVAITYTRRAGLPIPRSERPCIAWYGDMELIPHFKGIILGGPIEVTLSFCEPLQPELAQNRKIATRAAEEAIRARAAKVMRGHIAA
jgi:1-acyl-sn-glycerol-3-phosphate acyltransferase